MISFLKVLFLKVAFSIGPVPSNYFPIGASENTLIETPDATSGGIRGRRALGSGEVEGSSPESEGLDQAMAEREGGPR